MDLRAAHLMDRMEIRTMIADMKRIRNKNR